MIPDEVLGGAKLPPSTSPTFFALIGYTMAHIWDDVLAQKYFVYGLMGWFLGWFMALGLPHHNHKYERVMTAKRECNFAMVDHWFTMTYHD